MKGSGALGVKIACLVPPTGDSMSTTATGSTPTKGGIRGRSGPGPTQQARVGRPLFKGLLTGAGMASDHLTNTYFCIIDKRNKPSPKTVNEIKGRRLRRSRCTCSVTLHLTHGLVRRKTRMRVVVRSTGSKVHSSTCLSGDGQRAYVKSPVPLGRIRHLRRQYSGVGTLCHGSHGGCGCYHTVFVRMSDHDGKARASMFFCRSGHGTSDGQLTGGVGSAFRSGCKGRRPGHNFSKAIDKQGLCMLTRAAPMSMFMRLNGVRGALSREQLIVPSGQRTLTG